MLADAAATEVTTVTLVFVAVLGAVVAGVTNGGGGAWRALSTP
jgi:hypothetical protein